MTYLENYLWTITLTLNIYINLLHMTQINTNYILRMTSNYTDKNTFIKTCQSDKNLIYEFITLNSILIVNTMSIDHSSDAVLHFHKVRTLLPHSSNQRFDG
jgi:hypothetical protein